MAASVREKTAEMVSSLLTGIPGRHTELKDASIHGTYLGFNPLAATRGTSFEDCRTDIEVSEHGIVVTTPVEYRGTSYAFKVRYSPDWIFHLTGWGVDGCLAIRQHKASTLASLIFAFPPVVSLAKFDAIAMLGEGMPAVLGVYIRERRGLSKLRALYDRVYEKAEERQDPPWLDDMDVESGLSAMRIGTAKNRIQIIEHAAHNLWVGSESEVAGRLRILREGLEDTDVSVRRSVLREIRLGARVTGAIELALNALREPGSGPNCVVDDALDAACCLLYETWRECKTRATLEDAYRSSDISEIHRSTGGYIDAERLEDIERCAHPVPAHRAWTREQHNQLREAIESTVAATDSVSDETRRHTLDTLARHGSFD